MLWADIIAIVLGVVCGFFVIGIYFLITILFKNIYKYDVDVEHLSSDGKSRIERDYGRRFKLKSLEEDVIKLYKNKVYLPLPHDKTVKYGLKGRKKLEIVLHPDGYTAQYIGTNYPGRVKDAVTTEQRGVLLSQTEKASKRKVEGKWRDIIIPLGMGLYVVIGLVLVLAFWKDLYEPVKEIQAREDRLMDRLEASEERGERMYNLLIELESGKQIISSSGVQTINQPPSGGGS